MSNDLQPVLQYLEILSVKIAKLEAEQIVARNMIGKLAARVHQVEYEEMEALQVRMEKSAKKALLPALMQGMAVLTEEEVRQHLGIGA
ncbi:hypothetical protein [Persicitalea jodogahamensis]|uniref:Uncharacterized protein n=1 Tax=Persicitalea jodogahamensis TaxID=402147 RepID=A0A8J3GA77_9BACT|nr:hypothetical protein [Persicitalea jodogahamensis]GHB80865.1 hypothetical protein GCM10007390_39340 [Persicitalea jodogahamensis]